MRNALGNVTTQRRWTNLAVECYERGCICKDCYYQEFFKNSKNKCGMKATVLELVRVLGRPEKTIQPTI